LTFYQPEESGVILGYVDPDGSRLAQVCSDIAFGDLQLATDGAALLLVTPKQGWPSLYLIEPKGEIYPLVTNGLNIEARFDPSGRWVLFTTERVGKTGRELYAFDRETVSASLVQAGAQVTFDFLTDGRLITKYQETEDGDHQYYVGPTDGHTLDILELPEDIASYAFVSDDGQHLVYREIDSSFSSFSLFISDLDGNNAQELAQSIGLRLYYALSSDIQSILMGIGEGERGDRIELRNLATDESWVIADNIDDADFGFSIDGQWASAVTTEGERHTLYIIHTVDGSIREVKDAVNAFFSPEGTQLAYTVRQPDGNQEMYVISLDSELAQSLGPGVFIGWFPLRVMP
jgi:Tol biopolymer transport system component